jgi:hypothetical protein
MGAGDAADPPVASEPLGKSKLWPEAQTPASSTDSGREGHGAAAPATEFVVSSMDSVTMETAHVWPARVSSCKVCAIIEFLAFLISIFSENVRIALKNKQSGERNS